MNSNQFFIHIALKTKNNCLPNLSLIHRVIEMFENSSFAMYFEITLRLQPFVWHVQGLFLPVWKAQTKMANNKNASQSLPQKVKSSSRLNINTFATINKTLYLPHNSRRYR